VKPTVPKTLRIAGTVVATVAVVALVAFVWWGLTPLGPSEAALRALESDATVTVTHTREGWVFAPRSRDATAGFIFYPGGHVDARSYAPYARDVAAQGYLAVVPVMPLSLAVLSPNAASKAIEAYPQIGRWILGGHSLGGVMAAQYADRHPDSSDALVLLASYPASGTDLGDAAIPVASLVGTEDTVIALDSWEAGKPLLPEDTEYESVAGGNHAQWGDYGPQPGDTENPSLDAEAQRAVAVSATLRLLREE